MVVVVTMVVVVMMLMLMRVDFKSSTGFEFPAAANIMYTYNNDVMQFR